jgi:hypothetical protein
MNTRLWSGVLLCLLVVASAFAADDALPVPADGAEVVFEAESDATFFEISLGPIVRREKAISMSTHKLADTRGYFGRVARRQYKITTTASTTEIHARYLEWFAANGYTVLLDALGDSPMAPGGTSWALRVYGSLPTPVAVELSGTGDKSRRRYVVAERRDATEHRVLTVLVNPRRITDIRVQVDIVDVDVAATERAFPAREVLAKQLTADGRINLFGVRHVGKKTIPRDSIDRILTEIAAALEADPQLALTIEGRATIADRPDSSAALGQARASAVERLLVAEHGVPDARLQSRAAEISEPRDGEAASPDGIALVVTP